MVDVADGRRPFDMCVDRLSIDGDPTLTAIGQVVCRRWTVWPEHLLGRLAAGESASDVNNPPLSTGLTFEPSKAGYVVLARRFAWHLAHNFTQRPAQEIARSFGGYSPRTVSPWLRSVSQFEKHYPEWHKPAAQFVTELSVAVIRQLNS